METKMKLFIKQVDGRYHFSGDRKNWQTLPQTVKTIKDAQKWTHGLVDLQLCDEQDRNAQRYVVKYSQTHVFAAEPDGRMVDIPLPPQTPQERVTTYLQEHAKASDLVALIHFENEPMPEPEPEE